MSRSEWEQEDGYSAPWDQQRGRDSIWTCPKRRRRCDSGGVLQLLCCRGNISLVVEEEGQGRGENHSQSRKSLSPRLHLDRATNQRSRSRTTLSTKKGSSSFPKKPWRSLAESCLGFGRALETQVGYRVFFFFTLICPAPEFAVEGRCSCAETGRMAYYALWTLHMHTRHGLSRDMHVTTLLPLSRGTHTSPQSCTLTRGSAHSALLISDNPGKVSHP